MSGIAVLMGVAALLLIVSVVLTERDRSAGRIVGVRANEHHRPDAPT